MFNSILEQCLANKGGSFNLITGKTNPSTGYMVSLDGHEFRTKEFDVITLMAYTGAKMNHLSDSIFGETYLGIWFDGEEWVLDVSINVEEIQEALALGVYNEQEAIWDCAKSEEIRLSILEDISFN